MRILVAEDHPEIAALLVELLSDEGYSVTHAATQHEALRLERAERWDLFLVDLFSRSYNRLEPDDLAFLRELAAHAPVVVVTARAWASQSSAADLGVAALVSKPFDTDQLLGLIRSVASR